MDKKCSEDVSVFKNREVELSLRPGSIYKRETEGDARGPQTRDLIGLRLTSPPSSSHAPQTLNLLLLLANCHETATELLVRSQFSTQHIIQTGGERTTRTWLVHHATCSSTPQAVSAQSCFNHPKTKHICRCFSLRLGSECLCWLAHRSLAPQMPAHGIVPEQDHLHAIFTSRLKARETRRLLQDMGWCLLGRETDPVSRWHKTRCCHRTSGRVICCSTIQAQTNRCSLLPR